MLVNHAVKKSFKNSGAQITLVIGMNVSGPNGILTTSFYCISISI